MALTYLAAGSRHRHAAAAGRAGSGLAHRPADWAGWTITTYSLAQVLAMPVAGRLSDQFGRKTIFLSAAAVFTIASLLCGLSTSIYMLIALRGVQALGGGAFMPSASGIVAEQFGPDRDRALAMFTSILPIGGIAGPVLGGLFVTYWSWRGIFLINVPIGAALIVLCAVVIPRSVRRARAPVDVAGVLLLGGMLLAVMFGFAFLGAGSSSRRRVLPGDGRKMCDVSGSRVSNSLGAARPGQGIQ